MKTRSLGWTGVELTTIGLGSWAIGGGGWAYSWGPQDDRESADTIRAALDLGVNWIDTAAVYGLGHAEEVVGRALKSVVKKPFIATKCGLPWNTRGKISPRLKRDSVRTELEGSLGRLGVDTIDLYQIHWPNPDRDIEEAWTEIARLAGVGKIRYAGVSNFSLDQVKRIQSILPVASLQLPYSLLDRGAQQEMLGFCAQQNIGVVVYSPLQKGLLTGKMTRERIANLPVDDHRRYDPLFQEPRLSGNLSIVEEVRTVASRYGASPAHLALAWVLRRGEITSAIVGARRPGQITQTADAGDWMLPAQAAAEIEEILARHTPAPA